MGASEVSTIRVAVTQSEPVWLDLKGSVRKTNDLIVEAASGGAELVSFPEVWIPGYPAWLWSRPSDPALHTRYIKNSLELDSLDMRSIQEVAAENHIAVSLGFSERDGHTLYISQVLIDTNGKIAMHRRKMKPTHMERTVFGDASGRCLENVVQLPFARVGSLACWEHVLPLLKYSTHLQREEIHVAAWPPVFAHAGGNELWSMSRDGCRTSSRQYAVEGGAFVLHTTAVMSELGVRAMDTSAGAIMNRPGGGSSAIFGPDGRQLSEDLEETVEGILYADLDLDNIFTVKAFLDTCGHYSRPDLLWLGSNTAELKPYGRA